MRYRLMATYRGAPYEAGVGPADGAVTLFAACPPPEELGFEPAPGHWRKELSLQEVQGVWQSRPVGVFRGERCIVLDDLGDRLHICYLGHDAYRAEDLGYWQVDRGVFELVASRDEVTDIVEERSDYPGGVSRSYPVSGGFPSAGPRSGPQPAYQTGSYPAGGVALPPPPTGPAPLPLEAQAMRAASASARRETPPAPPAPPGPAVPPGGFLPSAPPPSSSALPAPVPPPAAPPGPAGPQTGGWAHAPRRRRGAGQRMPTEQIFSELATLAAIPPSTYSLGEEIDGAMCLLETRNGYEVFNCSGGVRHEVRVFSDEESAYFYLFGVLVAEAVRTGALTPARDALPRLR